MRCRVPPASLRVRSSLRVRLDGRAVSGPQQQSQAPGGFGADAGAGVLRAGLLHAQARTTLCSILRAITWSASRLRPAPYRRRAANRSARVWSQAARQTLRATWGTIIGGLSLGRFLGSACAGGLRDALHYTLLHQIEHAAKHRTVMHRLIAESGGWQRADGAPLKVRAGVKPAAVPRDADQEPDGSHR